MPLLKDIKTAQRVVLNLFRSRRNRAQLASLGASVWEQPAGSVQIAVYFADSRVNLYQIRQWYAPLAELSKTHQVAIISRSPGSALTLLEESPVPVVCLSSVADRRHSRGQHTRPTSTTRLR
ncbi:hypothetical protein [Glaciihabitans sp. UYNi722]|uniref:hypothetical protein n=1 Tax=Glaciihabitans sp. UYNi722 TaxID=3156344 RepID=UPI00339193E4